MSQTGSVFELPATWTGSLQVRGCIEADGCVEQADDCDAEFFGIYAQTAEGLHMWVADCSTQAQANDVAQYLKSTI